MTCAPVLAWPDLMANGAVLLERDFLRRLRLRRLSRCKSAGNQHTGESSCREVPPQVHGPSPVASQPPTIGIEYGAILRPTCARGSMDILSHSARGGNSSAARRACSGKRRGAHAYSAVYAVFNSVYSLGTIDSKHQQG